MRGWLPARGERLAPVMSALLLALSYPPLHPLVLPFVGLVPLAVWIHDRRDDVQGRAAVMRGVALFGVIYFGLVCHWLLIALLWFTKLAVPVFLAALALIVALTVAFGWLLHVAVVRVRAPIWLALPVTWTALEWTRAHLPSTLAFPWLGLGTSLTGFPRLVGIAELVGARGVTFWIALVNGLLAEVVLRRRGRRPWRALAALTLAFVIAPGVWGVVRAGTLEMRSVGRIVVVQPDIAASVRRDPAAASDSLRGVLGRLFSRVEPGSVGLAVLPEVALPFTPESDEGHRGVARLQAQARELGAPILFGAYGRGNSEDRDGVAGPVYNSAFVVEPRGLAAFEYDKRRLVPLIERVPFVPFTVFGRSWATYGTYRAGVARPLYRWDETRYGVLICFESAFAEEARAYRLEGADVLVNITNDGWFGREPTHARTVALWQHPAHLVMRAIENRMGVVRSANTGISLFVDPVGRVHEASGLFEEDVRIAEVSTTDVETFYTRYGDLLGNASAAAALLLLVVSQRSRGTDRDRSRTPGERLDPPTAL